MADENKKTYKDFIDSLDQVTMDDKDLNATYNRSKELSAKDYKNVAIYLSTHFDESNCPHNKFFAQIAWEKYEEKLKKNSKFGSDFKKIENLPQYSSVIPTYDELKASWLELQSLPPTSESIYDRNESRAKLSNHNFDKEKISLLTKISNDTSIEDETKEKLLKFVKSFTISADNKYFSDTGIFNCNNAKKLNQEDLKKIVNTLKRYTLNDPLNYGLEDNWGGFNTYVFRNAFDLYFDKLKDLGMANEQDIESLRTDHPFAISNAYEFISEQRKSFANELRKQQTTPLDPTNKKSIITDRDSLITAIDSFCNKFSSNSDKDFDHQDRIDFFNIIGNPLLLKPYHLNPYNSNGLLNYSCDSNILTQLDHSKLLKFAKYFLKKSEEESESLHKDEDGSKKIQINTYLARVFFNLYEKKLLRENFVTENDLDKLRNDIPFEYIGSPQKYSEITSLLKSKINKDSTSDFTRFFTNILNYDIDIDKALNEIYRNENNRDKLKDFLQEDDSDLATNLRKYILNKYDNFFDIESNRHSLSELKTWSAHGVFNTDADGNRYEKHDLENAKNHLATDKSVPTDVKIKKDRFARDSSGTLSLPPSPFSTKAVVEQIRSSSKIQR